MTEPMADKLETKQAEDKVGEESRNSPSPNCVFPDVEQLKNRIKYLEERMWEIEQCMKNVVPHMAAVNVALQRIAEIPVEARPKKQAIRRRNKNLLYSAESGDTLPLQQFSCIQPAGPMPAASVQQYPAFYMMAGASPHPYALGVLDSAIGFSTFQQPVNPNHSVNASDVQKQFSFCLPGCPEGNGNIQQSCGFVPLLGQSGIRQPFSVGVPLSSHKKNNAHQTFSMGANPASSSAQSFSFAIPGSPHGTGATHQLFGSGSSSGPAMRQQPSNNFSTSPLKSGNSQKLFTLGPNPGTSGAQQTFGVTGPNMETGNAQQPYGSSLFVATKNSQQPWMNSNPQGVRSSRMPRKFGSSLKTSIFQQPCSVSSSRSGTQQASIFGTSLKNGIFQEPLNCNSFFDKGSSQQALVFSPYSTTDHSQQMYTVSKQDSFDHQSFGGLWTQPSQQAASCWSTDVALMPILNSSAEDGTQKASNFFTDVGNDMAQNFQENNSNLQPINNLKAEDIQMEISPKIEEDNHTVEFHKSGSVDPLENTEKKCENNESQECQTAVGGEMQPLGSSDLLHDQEPCTDVKTDVSPQQPSNILVENSIKSPCS